MDHGRGEGVRSSQPAFKTFNGVIYFAPEQRGIPFHCQLPKQQTVVQINRFIKKKHSR